MRIGILYNSIDRTREGQADFIDSENEVLETVNAVKNILEREGHDVLELKIDLDRLKILYELDLDIIFNLAEGLGSDRNAEWKIAAFLELIDLPFTGSNSYSLAMCNDKMISKSILLSHNIPTPKFRLIKNPYDTLNLDLNYPLIVKPVREHGGIGIGPESVVNNKEDMLKQVSLINGSFNQPVIVEEYKIGREINVSIIGMGNEAKVLPISEITFNLSVNDPLVVGYEAKWVKDSKWFKGTTRTCPASLEPHTLALVEQTSLNAYKALNCSGYGRVDIRLSEGIPYVLDVNPNPCINPFDSGFATSSSAGGIRYDDLILKILDMAKGKNMIKQIKLLRDHEEIKVSNLFLRPVCLSDQDTLLKWFNDSENLKYMDGPEQMKKEYLETEIMKKNGDHDFVVITNDVPIGFASIYNIDRKHDRGEISYLIGEKEFQGKGFSSKIVLGLIEFAFNKLKLNSLQASATSANKASLNTLQRTGFCKIGNRRSYHKHKGLYLDDILFDITAEDHKNKHEI